MSRTVAITTTVYHITSYPRDTIREAMEEHPRASITLDGKAVLGICAKCQGILMVGDASCPHCPQT